MQQRLPTRLDTAPLHEVHARVVYQLIVRDYKRKPELYTGRAHFAILDLAHQLRMDGWGYLYWAMLSAAKFVWTEGTLGEWRLAYPDYRGIRKAHKARLLNGPRR